MCGIAGLIARDGRADAATLAAMTRAIAHRGPDGEGFWFSEDGAVGLGHRRLAILDPQARADQPMAAADGHAVIAYNGEIYNFLEVRTELAAPGHALRTESDTEAILAAWREWGPAMLPRFNGRMFRRPKNRSAPHLASRGHG